MNMKEVSRQLCHYDTSSIDNDMPHPTLLQTYRAALVLKLVGVIVGIVSGYILIRDIQLPLERWWFAGLNTVLTLCLLFPWWRWVPASQKGAVANRLLLTALILGLVFPNLEIILVSYAPYDILYNYPNFEALLQFNRNEVNTIHAYSQFFMMIPVVLIIWRGRFQGMVWSLLLAGSMYLASYFLVAPGALNLPLYIIRGFVMLGVLLILGFTTYFLAEAQRAEAEKLRLANQQLAEQAGIREALAISQERNRMARELHDTLAHTLSGTAVQLQAVKTLLAADPNQAGNALQEAQTLVKSGLVESRQAIKALRAAPLEEHGLAGALELAVQQLGARNRIQTEVDLNRLPPLPQATEQAIYRMIQEGLTNIEKHARASHVWLVYSNDNKGQSTLSLRDDGIGFNVAQIERENGRFGLLGMRERAIQAGATLEIKSEPGVGTEISIVTMSDDDE